MRSRAETERLEITGLPVGTMRALEELARENNQTPEDYARMVLEAKILTQKPFREILAPVREGFQESGISDDELAVLVERARKDFQPVSDE